jgi:signal transduction histidine kinase
MAYRFARSAALETAAARLATVAEAFAQPAQMGPAWARLARGIAASRAVIGVVQSDGRQVDDAVGRQFREFFADTMQSIAVDVRRLDGRLLYSETSPRAQAMLALGTGGASDVGAPRFVGRPAESVPPLPDSLRLGRTYADTAPSTSTLYMRGGHVLYERAVPIRDSGRVVAHIVEVRKMALTAATQRQLSRLVGSNAALIMGNEDGSLWFDLQNSVAQQGPLHIAPEYSRAGRRWMSATVHLPAAPWILSVEFPVDEVLAPVRQLGRKLFAVGLVVVLVGIVISERLSRRLTNPLTRLTVAAENIAAGDRVTRGFELRRRDEIGRLSRAFSVMADSIRETHDTLEHTIGHRTGELHTALGRLRETQEELLRKERLATLGQLSSSIAHELRNPLGVMTNALYYLEAVLHDAPPKVHDHLGKLRTQVHLSESIIRGLLDATRVSIVEPSEVDVAALLDQTLARVDVPGSIRVERLVAPDLPRMRADAVQIGQVLVNLLSNAVQAMDQSGGVLSIRAAHDNGRVNISVTDTGPGIPPEHRQKIFEPLFTTKARGIGLGLAVCRTLTHANGGELVVEDNPGGGARFSIRIPSATATSDGRAGTVTTESPPHGTSRLVSSA